MFLYKNQFSLIFSFLSITIDLWESTGRVFSGNLPGMFLTFTVISQDFSASGFNLLKGLIIGFAHFNITNFSKVFFQNLLSLSKFFQPQEPGNLL